MRLQGYVQKDQKMCWYEYAIIIMIVSQEKERAGKMPPHSEIPRKIENSAGLQYYYNYLGH